MLGQCWMQRSAALSCTIMWSSFLEKISCNCPMNVRYFRHLTLSKTGPTFWKIFNLNRCIFQGLDTPLKSPSPLPPQKKLSPTHTHTDPKNQFNLDGLDNLYHRVSIYRAALPCTVRHVKLEYNTWLTFVWGISHTEYWILNTPYTCNKDVCSPSARCNVHTRCPVNQIQHPGPL